MSECTRWIALSDRAAVGESLADEDRSFLVSHALACSACGAEDQVWRSLEALVAAPEATAPSAPATVSSPDPGPAERAARRGGSRRNVRARVVLGAIAIAAAAAAVAVSLATRSGPRAPTPVAANPSTPAPTTCVGFVSGDVDLDGSVPSVGAALARGAVLSTRDGTACLAVEGGVRACLSPRSRVRVAAIGGPERTLEVLAGRVVAELEPQAPGSTFTLAARDGTATAIGTAFSVEVPDGDGPSITRVLHGTVLVRPRDAGEKRVSAHAQTTMLAGPPTPLAVGDEARDLTVLVPAMGAGAERSAIARVDSDPPGATVHIDDRVAGRTPLAILLDPGEHALLVERDGASSRDSLRLAPGERLDRRFDLRPAAQESAPAASTSAAPRTDPLAPASAGAPGGDALSLLRTARDEGARGNVRASAAAYQALLARYPSIPEAIASECSYAELQLGPLGDAAGALRTFERYLGHGGPLAEEAAYGRIRALRALGRRDEERAAIDAFLRDHPGGAAASALRLRQRELEGPN